MTVKEVTYKEILDLLIKMEVKEVRWMEIAEAVSSYAEVRWEKGYELGKKHGKSIGEIKL